MKSNEDLQETGDTYNWLTKDILLEKLYRPLQHYNGKFIEKLNEILEEEE